MRKVKRFAWFGHPGADASHLFRGTPDKILPDHAF
jgi:hypothetical protein